MLSEDVDRYIALRRTLGYKLRKPARHLRAFAGYAASVVRRTSGPRRFWPG